MSTIATATIAQAILDAADAYATEQARLARSGSAPEYSQHEAARDAARETLRALVLGVTILDADSKLNGKHARVLKPSGANGNSALMEVEVEDRVYVVHNCYCRVDDYLAD